MKDRVLRRFVGVFMSLSFLLPMSLAIAPAQVGALTLQQTCEDYTAEVYLHPGDQETVSIHAELCYRWNLGDKPLQILLHGATYDSFYWDYERPGKDYSYVKQATAWGYATLNVDRLGVGESDKPDGLTFDLDDEAYAFNQMIAQLRDGSLVGHSFSEIVLVGHSFGSMASVAIASQYPQAADAVVLTGFVHDLPPGALDAMQSAFYPAVMDPKFSGDPVTYANYFTTVPGGRGDIFYSDLASSDVIAEDEELKEVLPLTGLLNAFDYMYSTQSLNIQVPVYMVLGEEDLLFCGGAVDCSSEQSLYDYESQYFSPAAELEVEIIGNTGHDLALHYNADITAARMLFWITQTLW